MQKADIITKRVILDTNVCLDLFVFRDPRWETLLTALKNGSVEAVTSENCRNEWLRVLDYPNLRSEERRVGKECR